MTLRTDATSYGPEVDELLYRACQEGLRNVIAHANAAHVDVQVRRVRTVRDAHRDRRRRSAWRHAGMNGDDHLGLRILGELVDDAGGDVVVAAGDAAAVPCCGWRSPT